MLRVCYDILEPTAGSRPRHNPEGLGTIMPDRFLNLITLTGYTLYEEAHTLQRGKVSSRVADEIVDTLIILEHAPVITLGHNADESEVLAKPFILKTNNIQVYKVERGGQATYHGPGQIVGYAIVDLLALKMRVEDFIYNLEETMIQAAEKMGVKAMRKPGSPGVYTSNGKIGSIGVRVTRGVTFHGFAFNVAPELKHFTFIKPCGGRAEDITSIQAVLGKSPSLSEARKILVDCFVNVFGMKIQQSSVQSI